MNIITNILFWISKGLLVPVILLLIFLFLRSLFLVGGFFGQYLNYRRTRKQVDNAVNNFSVSQCDLFLSALPERNSSAIIDTMRNMVKSKDNEALIEKHIANFENNTLDTLTIPNMLAKLGPMIGLMGTLIPMGPALVGLSSGDIASMAYNMQVAFATTVVGLFSAVIGFLSYQMRKKWYTHDMANIEYIANALTQNSTAS